MTRLPPPVSARAFADHTLPAHRGLPLVMTSMLASINLTGPATGSWDELLGAMERYNAVHATAPPACRRNASDWRNCKYPGGYTKKQQTAAKRSCLWAGCDPNPDPGLPGELQAQ